MTKILFKTILLFFFTLNAANANLYKISGLSFYNENDDTRWLKPDSEKDDGRGHHGHHQQGHSRRDCRTSGCRF